jgi:hypothetical protein
MRTAYLLMRPVLLRKVTKSTFGSALMVTGSGDGGPVAVEVVLRRLLDNGSKELRRCGDAEMTS